MSIPSNNQFENIFAKFKEKFPPADKYQQDVTLNLTTNELIDTLVSFHPDIVLPPLYEFMTSQGYKYEPVEFNDHILFYWILKRS